MEKNIIRVDLDLKSKKKAVRQLQERLAYLHDLNFLNGVNIFEIELIKKTTYGAKLYLKDEIKEENIILLQLILGSDWRKEVNTWINHFVLKMKYSNRMFDCKRYKNQELKFSKKINVTHEILDYVLSKERRSYFN